MNKIASLFAVALFALGPAVSHAQILPVEPLDGIVAIADEDVVLRSELDRAVNNILAQYAQNPERLPPREVLERQVLQRLIMQKLQIARADDSGIKVADAEIDRTIAGIAQDNGMDVGRLRMALQSQGTDYEQFRTSVRDELLIRQLRQRVLQGRVHVTDAEIDNLLKSGNLRTGQLHLAQILVSLPDGATPEQIEAAQAKADDVRRQVIEGLDFSAAAIRYSDAQNALEGGDLGWRGYDELPPAFAQAAESLSEGETSPVMRGPNGFYLVQLVGKRDDANQLVTEFHARHIMIKPSELTTPEEAHEKIVTIRSRILAGEDFAALAKQYSEDPSSANLGGDMGWFAQEAYGTRLGEVLGTLDVDEISEPFQTEGGWHIMQLLGTRAQDKTEETAREQARQTIAIRKADEEYESFLRQMRGESYVEIRLPGSPSTP
jgi:peptidyl-prolyl cis-trans isomerase SurA